jgi:hypothetical protein
MSLFEQQSRGKKSQTPFVLPNKTSTHGTNFSHNAVGGFVEFPTIDFRNAIPISPDGINDDGYSCGRRKFGMLVYVISENKYYQLIPSQAGVAVSVADWDNMRNALKMVLLDPTSAVDDFEDGPLGGDATYDVLYGSGDPDDCWVEVFKPSLGGGGDDYVNQAFLVKGVSIGSYNDGDSVDKDESLEEVIRKMLQKTIPPTYTAPTLSISSNISLSYEIGSVISPQLTPTWVQSDAGSLSRYILYRDSTEIVDNGPITGATSYTDSNLTLSNSVAYKASVTWGDGVIKNDNMGNPNANGRILSNTGSPLFSNTITFVPKRAVYFIADAGSSAPSNSAQIKALSSNLSLSDGSTFSFAVSTTAKRIVVAFPESYGPVTKIIDSGTGYDVKGGFSKTNIQVGGVNDYSPVSYNVYTSILASNYASQVNYTVTI